ncbi:MAG: mandelate racemase/muconate lactonizing enzyme family protein, partial [Thermovirgaceae bacterium]
SRPHLLVGIETEDGVCGYGEASPSAAFMGETAYTAMDLIERDIKAALPGISVHDRVSIHRRLDRMVHGNGGAKSAIDLAVHDAAGKALGLPVCRLIGGRLRDKVPQAWVLGIQTVENGLEEAKSMLGRGYKAIKVKVGADADREIELLRLLRSELGYGFKLRVDANQGFSVREAFRFLDAVRELDLECVEQPVPRWDIRGLREVRERGGVAVMADESCSSLPDAIRIIEAGAADILNIKVPKVGGLYRACQIAAVAEAAGLSAVAGSNIEAGLGSLANIHFAASQACMVHDNDQIAVPLYEEDLIDSEIPLEDGAVPVPEKPGLGVTLKGHYLEKLQQPGC